ncbi:MAG: hypothetical protein KGI37_07315 [Alphaproteobacteria bacterium]|nr:hypothetical protein [Alphaproteobacteria bacterium]
MNKDQIQASRNILRGLNYLANEADGANAPQIARIIKMCARDVRLILDNAGDFPESGSARPNEGVFQAIQFLARFASLKSEQQKRAVISEIERLGLYHLLGEHDAV